MMNIYLYDNKQFAHDFESALSRQRILGAYQKAGMQEKKGRVIR
jgi:hypothetical protein